MAAIWIEDAPTQEEVPLVLSKADEAFERFRSKGWALGEFLKACEEDGTEVRRQYPANGD